VLNTNLEGKRKVAFSLTAIRGIGPRLAHLICKIAKVNLNSRAGEIGEETWEKIQQIIADPIAFGVPEWFVNRRNDFRDGNNLHASSNLLESKVREDIERMKKVRQHRGLRHHWLLKVRGQMTCSTGRKGVAIGVVRKMAKEK
jgi:small subunit ribosomal protein S18e